MPRAELNDAARLDLWEIYAYYASEADIRTADRIRDELLSKIKLLAEHNLIGSPRFNVEADLRAFPHRKFVIFYFPREYGAEIVRVLHSARDIQTILEDEFLI